jgi:hypothetical protein
MGSKSKTQQKVQVLGRVSMPRKWLAACIEAVVCANSDCTKNSVQADAAIEGDHPEENIDPARRNEIVEDVHIAETTLGSEEM